MRRILIVDIFMPNMRGFESIRVFHTHASKVPLIAISGYAVDDPAGVRSRLPENGHEARRDALSAQAVPANDFTQRD